MHLPMISLAALSRRRGMASLFYLGLAIFVFVFVLISMKIYAFAHLFGIFGPHAGIKISQTQIRDAYEDSTGSRITIVPTILHQIFHHWEDPGNTTLPLHWATARQSCITQNSEWEVKLWDIASSRSFIEWNYPWFLSTYDGYKFPIQRVDVLKYFLLHHYGGIYIDLDNGCATNLDALTYLSAFTTDGDAGALSNNIMGGHPGHPWFYILIHNLVEYNWNWILPYIVISYTTGQWYVTAMFEKYHLLLRGDGGLDGLEELGAQHGPLYHILMSERPGADPWVFFTQTRGGTWTNWDNAYFAWLGDHIVLFGLGIAVLLLILIRYCCCAKHLGDPRKYRLLASAVSVWQMFVGRNADQQH